jgi:hypothetical protein
MSAPQSSSTTSAAAEPKAPGFFAKNKLWFIALGLFVLSNTGIYFYQKHQQKLMREACRAELNMRQNNAMNLTGMRSEEVATQISRGLIWGVRGEMERGNKELIELYLNKLVQESGVDLVIIQDSKDSVYLSTDKKYENHKVPYIQGVIERQTVLKSDYKEVVIAAPIMGMETRLGTCLIHYMTPKAVLDRLDEEARFLLPGEETATPQ